MMYAFILPSVDYDASVVLVDPAHVPAILGIVYTINAHVNDGDNTTFDFRDSTMRCFGATIDGQKITRSSDVLASNHCLTPYKWLA